jgi:predicted nucleic acid-binding protein
MIAFDTDVLTEVLLGSAAFVQRASTIPIAEQSLPVIVIEEIMRGRLNIIRQAEAGRVSVSVSNAYELFESTFRDFRRVHVLSYTPQPKLCIKNGAVRVSAQQLTTCASLRFVLHIPRN